LCLFNLIRFIRVIRGYFFLSFRLAIFPRQFSTLHPAPVWPAVIARQFTKFVRDLLAQ
jgi:hypothetical protein